MERKFFLTCFAFDYSMGNSKLEPKPHSNELKKKIYPKLLPFRTSYEHQTRPFPF